MLARFRAAGGPILLCGTCSGARRLADADTPEGALDHGRARGGHRHRRHAEKASIPSSGSDDTSYVASATSGDRDLYTMTPLGMTPLAIKGLQQTALARKDDAGDRALSLVLKSGAAVAVAPPAVLGSSYAFIEAMHETDPTTGAPWTTASVDAVQAGIEVAP